MKRFIKYITILLTLSLVFGSLPFALTQAQAAYADESSLIEGQDYVPGEVLLNVLAGEQNTTLNALEDDFGLDILEVIDQTALEQSAQASSLSESNRTLYRASFDAEKMTVFELCKALNALDTVEDAEPNYTYVPDSFNMPSEITASSLYRSEQKSYFDNMLLTEAWERYENLGEGITVCVIDNGLNKDHEEIKNRLWKDSEDSNICGYNAEFNNNDVYGKLAKGPAHGSHCAGIIAMEANNGGLVGVAPKAKIMMCNAVTSTTGYFTNANLIKSLEFAVKNGADVISMSLGGYSFSANMERALTRASYSAVILCAAGNEAYDAANILHYPSASSAVIGVMALGSGSSLNTLSDYSNYDATGRYYQVAAPGTDIYSISATDNSTYVSMSGTSMATPFMAGIAALYLSEYPELSPTEARHAIIEAAGEMISGYYGSGAARPFKKATPYTLLGESCAPAQEVSLNDRILNSAVRAALNVSGSQKLTNYDLESISHLDLSNTTFKNYAALAPLTKLTSLNLSDTGMTDEDAMALFNYLPNTLLNFDFSDNALTNLNFLENYHGYISRFTVANNQISNISALAGYTMLSDLDISCNKIKDISTVSTLSWLIYLYAPGNIIEDVSPIVSLRKLEQVYFGNYNPSFTDMFGELYFLSGSKGNHISSLAPLMNLNKTSSRLHYINLSYNYVNYDNQFHFHASKLMQIMDEICTYNKFDSIFAQEVSYKLVLSPFAQGELVFANDIAFENNRNFATLYMNGDSFTIPYSVLPAAANAKTGVSFSVRDQSVAFVDENGVVYPKAPGSTYVTLTLESGKIRTFFITVDDSYVMQADILNKSSVYAVGATYYAVVYTAPSDEIRFTDQNGNSFGNYVSGAKYCYNLVDAHTNPFQKWIVPFCAETAGEYTITVQAKAKNSNSFSTAIGSFSFTAQELYANEAYGRVYTYNSRFDTTVSLLAADDTLLQSVVLKGGVDNNGEYRFYNVANGLYTVLIERDGYLPYYIKNIVVNGNTFIDDDIDASEPAFADGAGDFNGDALIDIADISVLLAAENYALPTEASANMLCDINADNSIDVTDLSIVIANMAK